MSKKKGLSMEEKKQRMLDLFFEKKEFFQMKELEKLGPKEKGVVSQSVKEVVQMLVDEGLVDSEKIGTMVCFWAFPSKALNTRKHRLQDLKAQREDLENKLQNLKEKISLANVGKEDTEERQKLLSQVSTWETKKAALLSELDKYQEFDPERIKVLKQEARDAKNSVNRWTDNIDAVKQWCKNKFQIEEKDLNKQFGIPEELDHIG